MLARSRHLQGIFGLLKPFLHVQILICFVDVYQNHGVQLITSKCELTSWMQPAAMQNGLREMAPQTPSMRAAEREQNEM